MDYINMFIMMTVIDLAVDLGTEMTLEGIRGLLNDKFPNNKVSDGFIGKFLEQMPQRVSMFTTMMVMQHSNLIMNNYLEPFIKEKVDNLKDFKVWFDSAKGIAKAFTSKGGKLGKVKGVYSGAVAVLDTYEVTEYNQFNDNFMKNIDFLHKKQDLSNGLALGVLNGVNSGIIASNTKSMAKKTPTSEETIKLLNGLLNAKKYGG